MRIERHPILGEAREPDTTITFDGREIPAVTGEPIAAALLASGIRALRVTARFGQPRGIFCGIGRCNDCKVTVDGEPGARACVTPVRPGMRVTTQQGLGTWQREGEA